MSTNQGVQNEFPDFPNTPPMSKIYHSLSALFVACLATGGAFAATFTVTTAADDGSGSLRQKAAVASDGDVVVFDPSLNGQVIMLSEPIILDEDVYIRGNGPEATLISGSNGVFISKSGVDVLRFSDLAIVSSTAESGAGIRVDAGRVEVQDARFSDNTATGNLASMGGGAIANYGGSLYVNNVRFSGNAATGTSGSGGAIINGPDGALEIVNSRFSDNSASRAGGAVEDASGADAKVTFFNVDFYDNATGDNPGNGGAIHVTGAGDVSIQRGTASGNTAANEGGAFWNGAGEMRISDVAIRGNVASGDLATNGGGGVFNNGGKVIVTGSTRISRNVADGTSGSGGGVFNAQGGMLEMYGIRVDSNVAYRAGGGIEDASGDATTLYLADLDLVGNVTGPDSSSANPGNGGGLHVSGNGDVELHRGYVAGNTAWSEGGGLWNSTGRLLLLGTRVVNNVALGNDADMGGGGVFNNGGLLEIQNRAEISGNAATGTSGSGGGVFNADGGELKVVYSVIKDNSASRAGGGIEDASGASTEISLYGVTLRDNATGANPGNGGALHISGAGDAKIQETLVLFNEAASEGGGLWNGSGRMYVDNSTVNDNVARGDDADMGGGGIFNNGGDVTVINTTVASNLATGTSGSGGGVFNGDGGSFTAYDMVLDSNVANRAGGGFEDASGAGTVVELYNVIAEANVAGPEGSANPGNGGALHVSGAGDVTVRGGAYVRNYAASEGGGLWNGTGTMTISDVSVAENVAAGDDADMGGGGLFNNGGKLVVNGKSRINRNAATGASGSGGGIFNAAGGFLEVKGAFVIANTANRAGGGIEEASDSDGAVVLIDVKLNENSVGDAPGNGGGLHVTGTGDVYIRDSQVANNFAASEGGGLWNGGGGMVLDAVSVSYNTASGRLASNGGGGLFNLVGSLLIRDSDIEFNVADGENGSGGGILNDERANLRIERTLIANNSASRAGGGLEDNSGPSGTIEIEFSRFLDNSTGNAPGNGGGIHVTGAGNVNINGGLFARNTAAAEGGALWNGAGVMNLNQVSIRDNVAAGEMATQGGGGIFNNGGTLTLRRVTVARNATTGSMAIGGGVHNGRGGTMLARWSTVSSNTSANNAGGIANAGTLRLTGLTVANNTAANMGGGIGNAPTAVTATLRSTLVADNSAPNRGADVDLAGGAYVSEGYNLIENPTAGIFPADDTDIIGVDPMLGPLADNGGRTLTHRLRCLSPAIGEGDPALESDDQRSLPIVGIRDIGSFERRDECANVDDNDGRVAADGEEPTFEVFPTVSNDGNVSVRALDGADAAGAGFTYRLLDARGQVLTTIQSASEQTEVSFAGYAPGTYYVQRVDATGVETHSVIVR